MVYAVVVQSLGHGWLFVTPWTEAHQTPLSFPVSWDLLKFMSLSHWGYLTISSSAAAFSFCLQSFPALGAFPMSRLFASGGQSTRASASASVLPINIQGWFPLELNGLISLLSKGPSRVFSNTTVPQVAILRCSAFFMVRFSHLYMTARKKHSFDYMDLCQQSDVSAL